MQTPLQAACDAAKAAGRILLDHLGKVEVREKGRSDLVTDADLAAQRAIESLLIGRFPQFAFMGEESTADEQQAALACGKPVWIVDPLDGTTNFVHRLPGFAVSIALIEKQEVKLGVIFDPLANSLYTATSDSPAMKDGKPIRSSGCTRLDRAMVCCSFPPGVTRQDSSIEHFLRVLEESQSLRRLGSAALNLCYLAEGCLDSYWATSVKIWDIAAGYLIAKQTGVVFTNIQGEPFDLMRPQFLASSTQQLQQQMLQCMHGSASK